MINYIRINNIHYLGYENKIIGVSSRNGFTIYVKNIFTDTEIMIALYENNGINSFGYNNSLMYDIEYIPIFEFITKIMNEIKSKNPQYGKFDYQYSHSNISQYGRESLEIETIFNYIKNKIRLTKIKMLYE